jgi:hypothetical protein
MAAVAEDSVVSRRRFLLPLALAQFICSFAGSNMNVMINNISEDLDTNVLAMGSLAVAAVLGLVAAMFLPAKLEPQKA